MLLLVRTVDYELRNGTMNKMNQIEVPDTICVLSRIQNWAPEPSVTILAQVAVFLSQVDLRVQFTLCELLLLLVSACRSLSL